MPDSLTGMIIKIVDIRGKSTYWLITDTKRPGWYTYTGYNAIKCTSTGKQFTATNGFGEQFLRVLLKFPDGVSQPGTSLYKVHRLPGSYENATANILTSKEIGAKKRRVRFLLSRITRDEAELKKLKEEITQADSAKSRKES